MKFDIYKWQEVTPNEVYESTQGRLFVRASHPVAVYVQALGVEALAGVGTEVDVTIAEEITFRCEALDGTRVFVEKKGAVSYKSTGEVYSNIDRLPSESGNLLAVRAEMRKFQIEQSAAIRELREQRRALRSDMQRAKPKAPPKVEPKPEPKPDPAPAE